MEGPEARGEEKSPLQIRGEFELNQRTDADAFNAD